MKVKVIGVNPIHPEKSALLGDRELSDGTALRMSFKQPVDQIQLRMIDGELVVYLGRPIDIAKYMKFVEELKEIGRKKNEGV